MRMPFSGNPNSFDAWQHARPEHDNANACSAQIEATQKDRDDQLALIRSQRDEDFSNFSIL